MPSEDPSLNTQAIVLLRALIIARNELRSAKEVAIMDRTLAVLQQDPNESVDFHRSETENASRIFEI